MYSLMNKILRRTLFALVVTSTFALSFVYLNKNNEEKTTNQKIDVSQLPIAPYSEEYHALPAYSFESEPNYISEQLAMTYNAMAMGNVPSKYTGKNVKLAIIDSGINYNHEDFQLPGVDIVNINSTTIEVVGYSINTYTKTQNQSKLLDANGHGTNVASCIASQINGVGGSGIAPGVDLYIYNVVDYQWGAIQTALNECYYNDIDVINMSIQAYRVPVTYGGTTYSASYPSDDSSPYSIKSHIDACYNNGSIIVAAAGNYNTSTPSYPASYDNVISVGSLARSSSTSKASYSNTHGIDLVTSGSVYVAARDSNSYYKETQGTSFSSPLVAGAIALYKEKYPSATQQNVKAALLNSCDPISGNPAWAGNGRLNVERFLNEEYTLDFTNVDDELEVERGDTFQLEWAFTPNTIFNKEVHFVNLDDDVLTVSDTGLITALNEGESTIEIYSDENYHYRDEVTVTVTNSGPTPTVSSVSVTPSSLYLDLNGVKTGSLTATVNGTNDPSQSVTWSSDNTSVATVSSSGVVTAKAIGSTTIKATSTVDTTKYGTCTVNVTAAESQTLVITRSSFNTTGGYNWYSWSQATSNGVTISGSAELYLSNTSSMQFNKGSGKGVAALFNTTPIPGYITKIEATSYQTTIRSWTAYVTSTACSGSSTTLTFGENKTTVGTATPAINTSTSFGTSDKGYSYFCLQEGVTSASYLSQIKITYTPKAVSSIAIKTAPSKTVYESGETFDPTGLVVTATYGDNTTSDIYYAISPSSFSFSPSTSTLLTTSNTSVTITYGGKSCSQAITVSEAKTLSSISISGYNTNFVEGDTFAFGGTVTAHYSDGDSSNVTEDATFSGYNMTTLGNQTVTVSYTYKGTSRTQEYEINIAQGTLDSIVVSGQTTVYQKYAVFSFDGTCTATFTNGYQKVVTPTSVSSPNMTISGYKTVTISFTYNGKTKSTSYEITVNSDRVVIETSVVTQYSTVGTITWSSSFIINPSGSLNDPDTSGYTTVENNSLRLGSGSNTGSVIVSTSSSIITKVVVRAKKYGSDSNVHFTIGGTDNTAASSYTDYVKEYNTATNSVTISTIESKKRVNIESITVYKTVQTIVETDITNTEDCLGLESFINTYMHMDYVDNLGYCKDSTHHYYSTAKSAFNNLNEHQRTLFTSNSAYLPEWTRLSTWASFNGDSLNSSALLAENLKNNFSEIMSNNTGEIITILISSIGVIVLTTSIYLFKKRKD